MNKIMYAIRRFFLLLKTMLTSPTGLLLRAALLGALFLFLHWLGLREYTTLLSGTSPDGQAITFAPMMLGALYLFAWFGCVLIAPIFVIAAGVLWFMRRVAPALRD